MEETSLKKNTSEGSVHNVVIRNSGDVYFSEPIFSVDKSYINAKKNEKLQNILDEKIIIYDAWSAADKLRKAREAYKIKYSANIQRGRKYTKFDNYSPLLKLQKYTLSLGVIITLMSLIISLILPVFLPRMNRTISLMREHETKVLGVIGLSVASTCMAYIFTESRRRKDIQIFQYLLDADEILSRITEELVSIQNDTASE